MKSYILDRPLWVELRRLGLKLKRPLFHNNGSPVNPLKRDTQA